MAQAIKNQRRTMIVNPTDQRRLMLSFSLPTLAVRLTGGVWVAH